MQRPQTDCSVLVTGFKCWLSFSKSQDSGIGNGSVQEDYQLQGHWFGSTPLYSCKKLSTGRPVYTQRILVIMLFRHCNSNIFNDFKRFSSLTPRPVFCRASFVKKNCVLARSENRESGLTVSVKCLDY